MSYKGIPSTLTRMLFNMPNVTFFARSNNDNADTYSLYCRVHLKNEKPSEFSTEEKIEKGAWDQEKQVYSGQTEEKNTYINLLTERIRYKLKTIALLYEDQAISPKKVIEAFQAPVKKEEPVSLLEVLEKYVKWEAEETDLATITIAIHEKYIRQIRDYSKGRKVLVKDFDVVAAEKFKDWFRETRNTKKKSAASRPISYAKEALQWAIKKGLITSHNLLFYQPERDPANKPVSLTELELFDFIRFQFKSTMLNNIKDLFLFQIATGISYGDLWSNYTVEEKPEGKIIVGKREKGIGNAFFVPFDDTADIILRKHSYKLPKYCNGTYNRLLKEVAALVGITKRMHTHLARKTFATLKFSQGWTVPAVSLMLGHSSTATTEKYYIEKNIEALLYEIRERNKNT